MDPQIFNYWINCRDRDAISEARADLQSELDRGILSGVSYHAELNLLKTLSC